MPKLVQPNTKKVFLPSTENETDENEKAYVVLKDRLLGGDWIATGTGTDDTDRTLKGIAALITEWNYTDEQGQKLPITGTTVGWLSLEDITMLAKELGDATASISSTLDEEQKKTSSSTSTPAIPGSSLT